MILDRAALLTWLRDHTEHATLLLAAVYQGLADRIERGDFDMQNARESGGGITRMEVGLGAQVKTAPESVGALNPGPKTTPLELEGGAS